MLNSDDNGKIQKQLEKNTRLTFSPMDLKNKKFPEIPPTAACKQTLFFDFFKKLLYNIYRKLKIILSENLKKGGATIALEFD